MKIEDLIEMLKQYPPDLELYIEKEGAWCDVIINDITRKFNPNKKVNDFRYLLLVPY